MPGASFNRSFAAAAFRRLGIFAILCLAFLRNSSNSSFEAVAQAPRDFWAFQPIKRPAPPSLRNDAWSKAPIDRFILAKLEASHLTPAPPASKADLIRRVCFDLTGLPPSPAEVRAFVEDHAPNAYELLVDRLLASPHFGERWAQHWLDVVRYAETEGFEYDRHLPDAWRYRDYVIAAFNHDKPFDRFLTEQVAGDEISPTDPECQTAAVFHRLGPVRRNAGNPEIALSRNEVLTERTDVIGAAFLGLTVGCARCHDHKLDPIPQKDYYRLQAYLAATQEHDVLLASADEQQAWEAKAKGIKDEIKQLRKQAESAEGDERVTLNQRISTLQDSLPAPLATIPSIRNDSTNRTAIHVLKRGEWEKKGDSAAPRPLSVLLDEAVPELSPETPNPRAQLARWLTDPSHPLTARVMVNRLWQHHFGTGLVKTPNDFGTHGDRPSHPELLDWLASQLIENGWRLKPIHRLIVTSATYRQASNVESRNRSSVTPDSSARRSNASALQQFNASTASSESTQAPTRAASIDPENRLLSHFNRRRLSAEEIRDSMLAVSGRLNSAIGGRSIMVPVNAELVQLLYKPSQWEVTSNASEHDRRSIYLIAKRNLRLPFMETFDQPALLSSCGRRESSTHAPQALELLNGQLANELAARFAERLERETGGNRERLVERAFQLVAGREPNPAERDLALSFLNEQPVKEFALALFSLNAFLYVP